MKFLKPFIFYFSFFVLSLLFLSNDICYGREEDENYTYRGKTPLSKACHCVQCVMFESFLDEENDILAGGHYGSLIPYPQIFSLQYKPSLTGSFY